MVKLEADSKRRMRRGQLEAIILNTLAFAGIAALAMAAPNALKLLKHVDPDWIMKRNPRQRLYEVGSKLKRKGLVRFEKIEGKTKMVLTAKGRAAAQKAMLGSPLPHKIRWDERWRMLVSDVPEKRRALRDKVRSIVAGFGFVCLQDSVWVFPYDCEDVITLLKTELRLGTQMLYVIADAIEYDKPLRTHFNLPQQK